MMLPWPAGNEFMHVPAPTGQHISMLCLLCRPELMSQFARGHCSCASSLRLRIHNLTLQANAHLKQDVLRSLQQLVPTMIAAATGGADLAHPQHGQDMAQQQRHNQQMLQAVLVVQRQLLSGGTPQPAMTAVPAEQLATAQALAKGLLTGAAQLMKVTCC